LEIAAIMCLLPLCLRAPAAKGTVEPLDAGEVQMCFAFHQGPRPTQRAREYWSMGLQRTEAMHEFSRRAMAGQIGEAAQ
jgi:hypothetical protein